MAELIGTEKQVKWAMDIRVQKSADFDALLAEFARVGQCAMRDGKTTAEQYEAQMSQMAAIIERVKDQTSAAWWIDHRDMIARQILREVA